MRNMRKILLIRLLAFHVNCVHHKYHEGEAETPTLAANDHDGNENHRKLEIHPEFITNKYRIYNRVDTTNTTQYLQYKAQKIKSMVVFCGSEKKPHQIKTISFHIFIETTEEKKNKINTEIKTNRSCIRLIDFFYFNANANC